MAQVTARLGDVDYAVQVTAGKHSFIVDEPEAAGGRDAGAAPYDVLLASLGACTAITMRMYAKRKQLPLESVDVDLRFIRTESGARIERSLRLNGALTDEQRTRMLEIAEKTPVTLTLKAGTPIHTRLA